MFDIDNKEIATYIKQTNANVRETAKHFGVSRQTISNRIKQSKDEKAIEILNLHFKFRSKNKYVKNRE